MLFRRPFGIAAATVLAFGLASSLGGCIKDEPEELENQDQNQNDGECELVYELPDGESYALEAHTIVEPASIVGIASSYIGSIPPILLFVDGLTDGMADEVSLVGGVGERTGLGYDEVPGTEEDVYSIYYGSISPDTCEFQARFDGEVTTYHLEATSELLEIDLSGFSSLTEGLILKVEDVSLTGEFESEDFARIDDVVLSGMLSDEGLDELLEAVNEQIPLSKEQAMDILDPDDTGEIPVELELDGRRVVVDGFTDVDDRDIDIEPRNEEPCCPDGLEIGDSVIPYLTWKQQGLTGEQIELFQMALPEFRADPYVAMVTTARRQSDGTIHYEVYSGGAVDEGRITFTRQAGDGAQPSFEIIEQVGVNPLANVDPRALSDYEEFLDTGINPNDVEYLDQNYGLGDPRLGFVPPDAMHYPFAMERIAHNFDDPRTGDLMIIPASWSTGGFGTHGNLGALQSRSPLVMAGPGIRSAADGDGDDATVEVMGTGGETLMLDDAVRQVDIAPTIAAALGVEHTQGVGPDMRLRDDNYLGWQDGRVLTEIFTSEALDAIEAGEPVAERAVVIINDGLTNTEILFQVLSDNPDFDVDGYRQLFESGLAYRYGSISNFPSNTYPGHNTIGAGAWAGHHGIVDNHFFERELAAVASPIGELFETEHLLGSSHHRLPVETLHEAIVRTFGDLGADNLSASINDPSSRGAEFATLERRHPGGFEMPSEADEVHVGDTVYPLPAADLEDYTGLMDNASVQTFAELYQDHINRGEEGLPIPRFSIVNLGSTDTAGHAHGPHGDQERYQVVSRVNQRMKIMFEVLEYLDVDESTLVILTSDHGMELQDRSRSSSRARALRDADVSFRRHGWFYYFKELAVEVEDVTQSGDDVVFSLRAIDRGTEGADETVGASDVFVDVVGGGTADEARTDSDGSVEVTVTPEAGADSILFQFDSSQWNAHRERISF